MVESSYSLFHIKVQIDEKQSDKWCLEYLTTLICVRHKDLEGTATFLDGQGME